MTLNIPYISLDKPIVEFCISNGYLLKNLTKILFSKDAIRKSLIGIPLVTFYVTDNGRKIISGAVMFLYEMRRKYAAAKDNEIPSIKIKDSIEETSISIHIDRIDSTYHSLFCGETKIENFVPQIFEDAFQFPVNVVFASEQMGVLDTSGEFSENRFFTIQKSRRLLELAGFEFTPVSAVLNLGPKQ